MRKLKFNFLLLGVFSSLFVQGKKKSSSFFVPQNPNFLKIKRQKQRKRQGVNITNILWAAFMPADPKNAKKQ